MARTHGREGTAKGKEEALGDNGKNLFLRGLSYRQ